jgi:hypothetical protein
MYICSKLDAKEETDLPQVRYDFGEFHPPLEAYSVAEPARNGLGHYACAYANGVQDQKGEGSCNYLCKSRNASFNSTKSESSR